MERVIDVHLELAWKSPVFGIGNSIRVRRTHVGPSMHYDWSCSPAGCGSSVLLELPHASTVSLL